MMGARPRPRRRRDETRSEKGAVPVGSRRGRKMLTNWPRRGRSSRTAMEGPGSATAPCWCRASRTSLVLCWIDERNPGCGASWALSSPRGEQAAPPVSDNLCRLAACSASISFEPFVPCTHRESLSYGPTLPACCSSRVGCNGKPRRWAALLRSQWPAVERAVATSTSLPHDFSHGPRG